ncbi:hypothetical protein PT974_11486 [Cladobotryum mycophilum]|uniref:Yippee/Mis18/Cereblon domain-containing protein n=1 Tax=Cladobotryum mycophilum TaxID=491253 RepID=A0ABR0S5D0_9HYPO
MDSVFLKCANCDAKLGDLTNLWTQIGKKYITPASYSQDINNSLKVSASGTVRLGDANTLIEGCVLQEAECEKCHTSLGQKCLSSPLNHVLNDGQIIFRASSLILKSASDQRRKAEPKIQRILKLRGESSSGSAYLDEHKAGDDMHSEIPSMHSFDILQIQTDLDAQRQEMQRIGAAGFQVMSQFETAIARFEQQMKQLSNSIESVRTDGEGNRKDLGSLKAEISEVKWDSQNDSVVSRLDAQLQTTDRVVTELHQTIQKTRLEVTSLRDELTETQQELWQVKEDNAYLKQDAEEAKDVAKEGIATSKLYASEVSSLRREIKQLRSELAHERSHSPTAENPSFSSHQLDILASNISKIGNRASQVESLQMELELFRTRVQRLEAKASSTPTTNRNDGRPSMGNYSSQREPSTQSRYIGSTVQKRSSMGREDPLSFDTTPPKRMAISSDYPTLITASYMSTGEEQPSSPPGVRVTESPIQSRAKAISADRSKLRRTTWKPKK